MLSDSKKARDEALAVAYYRREFKYVHPYRAAWRALWRKTTEIPEPLEGLFVPLGSYGSVVYGYLNYADHPYKLKGSYGYFSNLEEAAEAAVREQDKISAKERRDFNNSVFWMIVAVFAFGVFVVSIEPLNAWIKRYEAASYASAVDECRLKYPHQVSLCLKVEKGYPEGYE